MATINQNEIIDFSESLEQFKPRDIVDLLDQYIIGQSKAKKLVALALRNRLRRKFVPDELKEEIAPKNILMIGPTGVGKTEIARRIAQLVNAPFIKVEATKFTERGYVGRDVEYMIRALANHSVTLVRSKMLNLVRDDVAPSVEKILQKAVWETLSKNGELNLVEMDPVEKRKTRKIINQQVEEGAYDDTEVEVKIKKKTANIFPMVDMFPGMEDMELNFQSLFGSEMDMEAEEKRTLIVREAREQLTQQYMEQKIDKDQMIELGIKWAQEMGIIFIDEIDKISSKATKGAGPDVSREGVQRDLLPIVEGTSVNTKYGMVKTDHILFIAAGAFHVSKPSDMIPELQGRFPTRVELTSLSQEDLKLILIEPKNSLIKQYTALMATENVELDFTDSAFTTIARIAYEINGSLEDIGARRLHTIMEYLLEDVSFNAPTLYGQKITIDSEYVEERLATIAKDKDLTKYIL